MHAARPMPLRAFTGCVFAATRIHTPWLAVVRPGCEPSNGASEAASSAEMCHDGQPLFAHRKFKRTEAVGVVMYPTFCQFAVQVFDHSCRVLITLCALLPKPTQVVLLNLVLRHAVCRSVFNGINGFLTLLERHSSRERLRRLISRELIYSCVGHARTSFCRARSNYRFHTVTHHITW